MSDACKQCGGSLTQQYDCCTCGKDRNGVLSGRIRALEAKLKAMTEDRDLWEQSHRDDCPVQAEAKRLREERDSARLCFADMAAEHDDRYDEAERLRKVVKWAECVGDAEAMDAVLATLAARLEADDE